MKQVIAHHINALSSTVFDFTVGLVQPKKAPRLVTDLVSKLLDLPRGTLVESSRVSRHSSISFSMVGDYVLIKGYAADPLTLGQVWVHAATMGIAGTVVQLCRFQSRNRANGTANFSVSDDYDLIEVTDIIDPVIVNEYSPGILRVILPVDIDMLV